MLTDLAPDLVSKAESIFYDDPMSDPFYGLRNLLNSVTEGFKMFIDLIITCFNKLLITHEEKSPESTPTNSAMPKL